ncbi:hypothetical protein [Butyrivibrio sp. AC2005]|uniref:hypothetical protein n=1 Tax=Butyrivibrio sp. AC2005 TaxID=1280672 RepID=UPI00040A5D4B|nr:hypothetical protein [Butyrivibrio sp. AC2005]
MKKDLKLIFKLLKYGPNGKKQFLFMGVFTVFGIVMNLTAEAESVVWGLYLLLPCSYVVQMIYPLCYSSLYQSSPLKKKTQTYLPYLVMIPLALILFTLMVVIHVVAAKHGAAGYTMEEYTAMQSRYILITGIMAFCMYTYIGICYKYFVGGMIGLFVIVIPLVFLSQFSKNDPIYNFAAQSLTRSVVIGYVLIILGCIMSVVLANLLYKKELSRLGYRSVMMAAKRA